MRVRSRLNLLDLLFQNVKKRPKHFLVVDSEDGRGTTYGEFYGLVLSAAGWLQKCGVRQRHVVALHYPNSTCYICLTYAIWFCDACVLPIPLELTNQEKQEIFRDIRIDAFVSKFNVAIDFEPIKSSISSAVYSDDILFVPIKKTKEHPTGFYSLHAAFIRFSSGTTDKAKGVLLSHESIYERICIANQSLKITQNDKILWLLSMACHFTVSIVAYLSFGATIILPREHSALDLLRIIRKHKVTIVYGAPRHYQSMLFETESSRLPTLRLALTTTTSLQKDLAYSFYERFEQPLNEVYGLIEVGLPAINLCKTLQKIGSVGRFSESYEIWLEETTENFEMHKIHIRGSGLFDAYYHPWQARLDFLKTNHGWFFTGDLGKIDRDGYLFVLGRAKEIINVGGLKIFPQEIESVLEQHPAIQEACAFGFDDQFLGEVPHVALVTKTKFPVPRKEELEKLCISYLAHYKIPKQFYFMRILPKNINGKLLRRTLKKQYS